VKIHNAIYVSTLALLLTMPLAYADKDEHHYKHHRGYDVHLMPLNNSGVHANVEIKLKGNRLTVSLEATGLEPGKPHPQHIHGHADTSIMASCPGVEADSDGDGLVSVSEGAPDYGPIIFPLTPFNLVDNEGNLEYELRVTVNPDDIQPIHKRAIVLHGMTVNGEYIPSLPVACGVIGIDD